MEHYKSKANELQTQKSNADATIANLESQNNALNREIENLRSIKVWYYHGKSAERSALPNISDFVAQTSWSSLEKASAAVDEKEAQKEEEEEAAASGRRLHGSVTIAEDDDTTSAKKSQLQSAPTYAIMESAGKVAVERAERALEFAKSEDLVNGAPHLVSSFPSACGSRN